ncbi:transcription factor E2F2 [Cololabis saira]|uniref:transcription factor E2F2 n=1 Tax=Cololabis saira TaxID=129043 RepID=UPI002AD36F8D|nr:transcription factor E2F2 [Cololabis saira]
MKCVVSGCTNRTLNLGRGGFNRPGKRFFSFPKDPARGKVWLAALRETEKDSSEQHLICEDHFLPEDISSTGVNSDAIPIMPPCLDMSSAWGAESSEDEDQWAEGGAGFKVPFSVKLTLPELPPLDRPQLRLLDPPEPPPLDPPEPPPLDPPELPPRGRPDLPPLGRPDLPPLGRPDLPPLGRPDLPPLGRPDLPPLGRPDLPPLGRPDLPPLGRPDLPPLGRPDLPPLGRPDLPPLGRPDLPPLGRPEPPLLDPPELPRLGRPDPAPLDPPQQDQAANVASGVKRSSDHHHHHQKKNSPAEMYTRDDVSLSVLTRRFLDLFLKSPKGLVDLKHAITSLRTRRRRFYDITNVLEGVKLIERSSVNTFQWIGSCPASSFLSKRDVQGEMDNLKLVEDTLDSLIKSCAQQLFQMTDDLHNSKLAYVTHQDVCRLQAFQNQTVITVKAPEETKLEIPAPKEDSIQVHLKAGKGPIVVMTCDIGTGERAGAPGGHFSPLEESRIRTATFHAES